MKNKLKNTRTKNFWYYKSILDELIFLIVNFILILTDSINLKKKKLLKKNKELKRYLSKKKAFVLGNGPSISKVNLNILKKHLVICVNRGHKNKFYKKIKPQFHCIIDPKLINGQWPLEIIDEIIRCNPKVIFLFNIKYYYSNNFMQHIIKKKIKYFWLDPSLQLNKYQLYHYNITKKFFGIGGVVAVAMQVFLFIGYKKIHFLGFDGDGLFKELYNKQTHSYGYNIDNFNKTFMDYSLDFYQVSLFYKRFDQFSKNMISLKKKIINCSSGGIINFFPRKKMSQIFNKKK